jgi:hypothetical protein
LARRPLCGQIFVGKLSKRLCKVLRMKIKASRGKENKRTRKERRGKFAGNFLFDQIAEYLPRGNAETIVSIPIATDVHNSYHPALANFLHLKCRRETLSVQIRIILSTVNLSPFLS